MLSKQPPTSLRKSLLRMVIIPALLVLLILSGIVFLSARLIFLDVENEQTLMVQTISRLGGQYLEETRILLENVGSIILELDLVDQGNLLEHTYRNYPRFTALYLLDLDGRVLIEKKAPDIRSLQNFDLSGETYFKVVKGTQQSYFSDTFFSIATNDIAVTVAEPVFKDGEFKGVLVGELNLDNLQETIREMSLRDLDTIFILDDRATVIAHPDREKVLQQENMGNNPLIQKGYFEPAIDIFEMDSVWSIASAAPMKNGWLVVTSRPVEDAIQPLIILVSVSVTAFLFSVFVLFFGIQRSVRRISIPITRLAEKTEEISKGNYAQLGEDATRGRYTELNALSASFNRMAETIALRTSELLATNERLQVELDERHRVEAALRDSEARYRSLFEGTPIAILEEDFSEVHRYLESFKEKYGTNLEKCLAQNPNLAYECAQRVKILAVNQATLRMHKATSRLDVLGDMLKIFQQGVPDSFVKEIETIWYGRLNIEMESVRKQGEGIFRYAMVKWSALPNYREPYDRVLVSIVDVTQLKEAEMELKEHREHLEELVEERTAELQRANMELESFAYTVSHDLRAPLRHIDGYSGILLSEYGQVLDEQGRTFLENVRKGSQNMSRMIDGLLQLSRASRGDLNYSHIDLSALADEISQELQETEPERQVDWVFTSGCQVQGDGRLLRAAMQNLLGNAWKFTLLREHARIEFGCMPQAEAQSKYNANATIFFVRDNGAGFDMKYASKLFTPFQRLHSEEQFAGTGIGLATVQRIIRRHGGDIWVESAANEGTTFYFTLP